MSAVLRLSKGLATIARSSAARIANIHHRQVLANPPLHDDLYVVSFPKSGATWMNFLMANLHLRLSGDPRQVTFFNVHDFVPDIHSTANIGPIALKFPGHRVIKSHAVFNPFYRKVFYVVRDPRAVMVSYHHFLVGLGQVSGSVSETIRHPKFGVSAWCDHVAGWIENTDAAASFVILKYEDLKADTMQSVRTCYRQMGYYELDAAVLEDAVKAASFTNMQTLERELGFGGPTAGQDMTFVRQGESQGWAKELSLEDIRHIEQAAAEWMSRLGYEAHQPVQG